jgi:PIN domain nuclease of toxin-antitoxin system
MSEVVLDASIILAVLNQEDGSQGMTGFIANAAISTVNLSEVVAKMAIAGIPEEVVKQILSGMKLKVIPFSEEHALRAGMLIPFTRSLGLSLGDRACLALGLSLSQPVLTTDRLWGNLNLGIEIRVMR